MHVTDTHRFYYLHNFQQALTWLSERYGDVLRPDEAGFIQHFGQMPQAARALFVRMAMRKGPVFRTTKLQYDEIGCPVAAAQPLVACGWVDDDPMLSVHDVLGLLTRQEAIAAFQHAGPLARLRKADMLAVLQADSPEPRGYRQWWTHAADGVLGLRMAAMCERLRAMFFGNLRQQWSEFVLADLGVYRYEVVPMDHASRPFSSADDVDHFLTLHACRQALEEGAALDELLARVDALPPLNDWLAIRVARLRYLMGQCAERRQDWPAAMACYDASTYPGARYRRLRVLERSGDDVRALAGALAASEAPESEEERQYLDRMLPRLKRRCGDAVKRQRSLAASVPVSLLALPRVEGVSVERIVQSHLATDSSPVYYVENTLVNGLFGLLCWDVIFAAVPGAFFHPFQSGPADLHSPEFRMRRSDQLTASLAQLDSHLWRETIRERYLAKHGIYSPFVAWSVLTPELLELALQCIPAQHLRMWFGRLLDDIKSNRTGWPDLIQFFPDQSRYALIEVKGPGDRLQDNQRRWLDFCMRYDMPVQVAYVTWSPT